MKLSSVMCEGDGKYLEEIAQSVSEGGKKDEFQR